MLLDTDLEKLVIASRQKLVREFAEKHADLRERIRRVQVEAAKEIADKLSCPLQVAMMAYLIEMDGILSIKDSVSLMTYELERRAAIGAEVPNIPGNVMEFAVGEGRWLEHIYGTFARNLELKVRELANLEAAIDIESASVEKAQSVMAARTKLAETFIGPVVETWLKDHPKSNSEDLLMALGPAITKWKRATLKGKLLQLRKRAQALFRRLRDIHAEVAESATMEAATKRISDLVDNLDVPLDKMNEKATSHFILHIVPRPTGRGDKSSYVDVGAGTTRGNRAEPDMGSPFDYLERDVRLAKRRDSDERVDYLMERIGRVLKVLRYQGMDLVDGVQKCLAELEERLDLKEVPIEQIQENNTNQLANAPLDQRELIAAKLVYDYVETYAFSR